MSGIQSLPIYPVRLLPVKDEFAGYKMSIHLVLKPMNQIPFRELLSGNISAYLLQKIF